ncbi:MAG TPA: hypothetical protein VME24_04725, partial [Alphaproteobacteria bacterium]|nr:hypothetical protein [Alphaproteobacteria bacterium]
AVSTNGANAFSNVTPRQFLSPVPYAITAENVSGALASSALSGTYSGAVTFNNSNNSFTGSFAGNGANVTNVNAAMLNGLSSSNFWQTGGNNVAAGQFLGSTNFQIVQVLVNGTRAFLLTPTTNDANHSALVNVVGGSPANTIVPGAYGSVIGGGGASNYFGASTLANTVASDLSFIGGGGGNSVQTNSTYSVIGGGEGNFIQPNPGDLDQPNYGYGVIGGGQQNSLQTNAYMSFIGGGQLNSVQVGSYLSVLGGGEDNIIQPASQWSVLAGGYFNVVQGGGRYAFLGGGYENLIGSNAAEATVAGGMNNSDYAAGSTIGGGQDNTIQSGSTTAVIAGGNINSITGDSPDSFIGGGFENLIQASSGGSDVIAGGFHNTISSNGNYSAILGGDDNIIQGSPSYTTGYATIVGGYGNVIEPYSYYSFIGGGLNNTNGGAGLQACAVVPGGYANYAGGEFSFAAGQRAKANFQGDFVWADSQAADFNSTANDEFLIRAQGGVGINKGNPAYALDVAGTVNASSFIGIGAGLTNLNASQITTGTLPVAQLPPTVVVNGAQNTVLGNLFATTLELPNPATISSAFTTFLTIDANDNSYFGLYSGSANKGNPGAENTGVGYSALVFNASGYANTALGYLALEDDPDGVQNTGLGSQALQYCTNDNEEVAVGSQALQNDNASSPGTESADGENTAVGFQALQSDTIGFENTAIGFQTLTANTTGNANTAIGDSAAANLNGNNNTAVGFYSLSALSSGSGNIAIGNSAGHGLTSGNNNIDIGNIGVSSESGIIRIGTPGTHSQTYLAGNVNCSSENVSGSLTCPNITATSGVSCAGITVSGNASCASITITGGSDLAEPFRISSAKSDVPPGSVVVIDPSNPGHLKLSDQPYDTGVAGVVSGANGIHPGIQMQQQGLLAGGKDVALSGRVYVLADTSNGPIKPTDMLTTSSIPGYAMKVTDHARAQGAILGKAMTGLSDGKGMVLVLVTLQ